MATIGSRHSTEILDAIGQGVGDAMMAILCILLFIDSYSPRHAREGLMAALPMNRATLGALRYAAPIFTVSVVVLGFAGLEWQRPRTIAVDWPDSPLLQVATLGFAVLGLLAVIRLALSYLPGAWRSQLRTLAPVVVGLIGVGRYSLPLDLPALAVIPCAAAVVAAEVWLSSQRDVVST